jgi:hypothetical protein
MSEKYSLKQTIVVRSGDPRFNAGGMFGYSPEIPFRHMAVTLLDFIHITA